MNCFLTKNCYGGCINKCEEKERIFCDGDKKVKVRMPGVGDSTENKVTLRLSLSSQPPNVFPKTFQGCCSEIKLDNLD